MRGDLKMWATIVAEASWYCCLDLAEWLRHKARRVR